MHSAMSRLMAFLGDRGASIAYAVIGVFFTLVPEEIFRYGIVPCSWSDTACVIVNRLIVCGIIFSITKCCYYCYLGNRNSVTISDRTFSIKIEYADLLEIKGGLKVVSFDECFNTNVGERPEDVKPGSICGQYLTKYPIDDMQRLIKMAAINPSGKSLFNNLTSYDPGVIIQRGEFLLMSFAKLNDKGLGFFTYNEYLNCLNLMWKEIDCYHGTHDVYVPVLGSRIVRFDRELTQGPVGYYDFILPFESL